MTARAEGAAPIFVLVEGCQKLKSAAVATWSLAQCGQAERLGMIDLIQTADSPQEIISAAQQLRETINQTQVTAQMVLEVFDRWADALDAHGLHEISGIPFLRLWLRRSSLEPVLLRELGPDSLEGGWQEDGRVRLRAFPLGIVGHWPSGNVETQPILSLTCALLGGNGCLVRVPSGLVDLTQEIMDRLRQVDQMGLLTRRVFMTTFDHSRTDLHEAMARVVDGAMIWGGMEAVSHLRTMPFTHWARLAIFGPRISVAAMDAGAWAGRTERAYWCRRIARDVWQFDQQACSSAQSLFLERGAEGDPNEFVEDLGRALREENRLHPRQQIHPALTSAICLARASWLLDDAANIALFPESPDWTILMGKGVELPNPTQGRTLTVLLVDDLLDVISRFNGAVQTLGLAIKHAARESILAEAAGRHGVDRVVKMGSMHTFSSPWDGTDLIRPMVRLVRHVPSTN
jgi:Acyl-CoA reductase (LuxC)